jgi:two-component system CheB/CheR fusion protein
MAELPGSLGRRDMEPNLRETAQQELEKLKLYYDTVLATLEPGVLVMDGNDTVITENDKILKLWNFSGKLVGNKLERTELWVRCPMLKQHLEESRASGHKTVSFECKATAETVVMATIKPILSESGAGRVGTLIYMENVTPRVTLQSTVEELETTTEELQSSNEELETTNEELQSTNEELETTNEELQSTNEELETTNEELQSLNEELETTNEELSSRTRELDEVNSRYSEMMERMPWPVLLVNDDGVVYMFNSAAQKLFGFASPSDKGMKLQELPLDTTARQAILRRHRAVLLSNRQSNLLDFHLTTNRFEGLADIHFTPLSNDTGQGVIVMFQINRQNKNSMKKVRSGSGNGKPRTKTEEKNKKSG